MSTSRPPRDAAHPGWMPLVAVCLGTFMLLVDVTIVNVALPDMSIDLGASFSGLQWVVDVYALALAALLLLVGSVSDILGRRRTYVAGLALFVASSLACGLAPSEGVLIAARAVQGVGAAAMFATTIALLNATYVGRDRGVAFGAWGATAGAAAAAGPIVGGLLTQGLSWRWIFFVNVPVGIVTIVMARRALRESRLEVRPRIDWTGGAAFTVAAAAATFALVRVSEEGWGSTQTLSILAASLVALAVFVLVERRTSAPMLDLALLRRPSFVGILLAAVLLSVSAFGALVYTSIWLQTVLGLGAISAGLVTLPLSALSFGVSAAIGRHLHGLAPRWTVGGGLVVVGIGDLLMTGLGAGSSWTAVLPGLAVVGLGVGVVAPTLVAAGMSAVPVERGGMAAGAVNTGRQLGLAMGIAALGSVFSAKVVSTLGDGREGIAHAVTSGGAQGVLARVPAGARDRVDQAIHQATASGLGETFLVAGLAGVVGGVVVMGLLTERRRVVAATGGASTARSADPDTGAGREAQEAVPA